MHQALLADITKLVLIIIWMARKRAIQIFFNVIHTLLIWFFLQQLLIQAFSFLQIFGNSNFPS